MISFRLPAEEKARFLAWAASRHGGNCSAAGRAAFALAMSEDPGAASDAAEDGRPEEGLSA
jgi:hypothetical protein